MTEPNETDQAALRRYNREFFGAFVGYVVALLAIIALVDFDDAGWWKYMAALIPLAPAALGVRAVTRHAQRIDEMQRSVLMQAFAVGFGAAMLATMTLGFLAMAGLDSHRWGPWVIYSVGMLGWVAGQTRSPLNAK